MICHFETVNHRFIHQAIVRNKGVNSKFPKKHKLNLAKMNIQATLNISNTDISKYPPVLKNMIVTNLIFLFILPSFYLKLLIT